MTLAVGETMRLLDVFTAKEDQKLAQILIILNTSNHKGIMDQFVQQRPGQIAAQITVDSYQPGQLAYLTLSKHNNSWKREQASMRVT
jgi:hypothetical protein